MPDVRCTNCKEVFEIDSIEISANYDCPHCGKNIKFTSELDRWVKKVYQNQIEPDFLLLKSRSSDALVGIVIGMGIVFFGLVMLYAWMFIFTIPAGLFCLWWGFSCMFTESTIREVFSVYDKEKSRNIVFVYENGELVESSQNEIIVEERCRIVCYSFWEGGGDTGSTVWMTYITQKTGAIRLVCDGFSKAKQFADYLGITYDSKGSHGKLNSLPDDSHTWTEW